jgi:uncharacterized DUF497 family protein
MLITYDYFNLRKHRVAPQEADEVLANDPLDFELTISCSGNDRVMFVGFTYAGRLLEVGVEYVSNYHEHVFHAMRATKSYRKEIEKRIRK